jgi:hypothetical protein
MDGGDYIYIQEEEFLDDAERVEKWKSLELASYGEESEPAPEAEELRRDHEARVAEYNELLARYRDMADELGIVKSELGWLKHPDPWDS